MATGYDNQQPQRQSFAFQGAAPAQSRSAYQGTSKGSQVVGGDSQGGVVLSGPQTDPGAIGGQLGAYFEGLMQPYLERKQQEGIYRGFHAAQSGVALSELSDPDNPVTKIFGPTGFEQGAQMYTAQTAVSSWQAAHLSNMDKLIQMDAPTLAKHLADTSTDIMTGDRFADDMIQRSLMEATGPLMNTVVKTQVKWQQDNAVTGMHAAVMSSGTALQSTVTAQINLGAKGFDPAGTDAIGQSMRQFTGLLAKPFGMTDESYHTALTGIARDAMQSGSGYAVEAMKPGGRWFGGKLTPEEEDKLDEKYLTFGARANGKAAEAFTDRLIAFGHHQRDGTFSAGEAAAELISINEAIKRSTGFDYDVFDAKDVRAGALTVTDALIAADNRRAERDYQRQLRNEDWAHDAQVQAQKEARETTTAQIVWRSGSPVQGIAGGVKKELVEAQASNDWYKGDIRSIVRVFSQGYVSDAVKAAATSNVEASVGEQYNKDFAGAYQRWSTLNSAKPAAALAYYGKYHPMMQRFDSLTKQGTDPITAFSRTFGDSAQYSSGDVGPERSKVVNDKMEDVVSGQTTWNPFGQTNLGELGNNVVKQIARNHVAVAGNNSPISTEKLMNEAVEAAIASGEMERAGQFAWRNKPGTKGMAQMLGLRDRDFTHVFTQVYNQHLTSLGIPTGTDPDSLVRYDANGHPAMLAVVKNSAGAIKRVVITYDDLGKAAHTYVRGRMAIPQAKYQDPLNNPGGIAFAP